MYGGPFRPSVCRLPWRKADSTSPDPRVQAPSGSNRPDAKTCNTTKKDNFDTVGADLFRNGRSGSLHPIATARHFAASGGRPHRLSR